GGWGRRRCRGAGWSSGRRSAAPAAGDNRRLHRDRRAGGPERLDGRGPTGRRSLWLEQVRGMMRGRVRIQMSFWSDLAGKLSSGYTDKGESSFKPMGAGSNPAAGTSGSDRRSATVAVPGMPERRGLSVQRDASGTLLSWGRRGRACREGNPPGQLIHLWTALATRGSGLDPLEQVAGAGPAFRQNVVVDRDREAAPVPRSWQR